MPDKVSMWSQPGRGPSPGKETGPCLVPVLWVQGRGLGWGMEIIPTQVQRETSKGMGGDKPVPSWNWGFL